MFVILNELVLDDLVFDDLFQLFLYHNEMALQLVHVMLRLKYRIVKFGSVIQVVLNRRKNLFADFSEVLAILLNVSLEDFARSENEILQDNC